MIHSTIYKRYKIYKHNTKHNIHDETCGPSVGSRRSSLRYLLPRVINQILIILRWPLQLLFFRPVTCRTISTATGNPWFLEKPGTFLDSQEDSNGTSSNLFDPFPNNIKAISLLFHLWAVFWTFEKTPPRSRCYRRSQRCNIDSFPLHYTLHITTPWVSMTHQRAVNAVNVPDGDHQANCTRPVFEGVLRPSTEAPNWEATGVH